PAAVATPLRGARNVQDPASFKDGQTMNPSTVSAELAFRLIVPPQTVVPLGASLSYSSEDPYAIRVAFHVGLDEPVEWIFARELLSNGLKGRDGLGDVRVWPAPGQSGAAEQVLHI